MRLCFLGEPRGVGVGVTGSRDDALFVTLVWQVCMLFWTERRGGNRDCSDVGSRDKTVDETVVCSILTSSKTGVQ